MPVAAPRRRADRDKHGVRALDRAFKIGRKAEPAGGDIAGDELVEPGSENRDFAPDQTLGLNGLKGPVINWRAHAAT
jgi:hypothetical protein